MDESLVLALSLAEAVEADAALIEQFLEEDQMARENMIEEAQQEGRQAPVEASSYQTQLDEETYNSLRLLNIAPANTSDAEDTDSRENLDAGADGTQNDQSTADAQAVVHMDDTQDTVGEQDINDDTASENRAAEAQDASIPEEQTGESKAVDETVNVQPVSEEQDEVQTQPTPDMKQCISCQDDFPDDQTLQAPCSHHWCQPCFDLCFENALKDESLFPPRCCEPIPIESGKFISEEQVDRFQQKTLEFSTTDRTYCSDTTCATFILPQSIEGDIGRCPQCEKLTCALCKQAQHEDICPEDTEAQQVLRLGEQEGWQRCGKCKHLVALVMGCYHITCSCHHQFCYLCGAQWKTCQCPQWDENRLLDAAAQRAANAVERARRPQAQAQPPRPAACFHPNYERIPGQYDCRVCNQTLRQFILRCETCRINLCYWCFERLRRERRG